MATLTIEPLKWQEDPSRLLIDTNESHRDILFQVTSPKALAPICCGRPVEELPRILPMLAPAHHLAAAQALDRLFEVEPPELAQNMRKALLQAQYCSAHLRKLFFLATSGHNPLQHPRLRTAPSSITKCCSGQTLQDKIMHHMALSLEAEDILGGRHDYPLTAVAGGVSRYLKEGHYSRLITICDTLLPFAQELSRAICEDILNTNGLLSQWITVEMPIRTGLHLNEELKPTLTNAEGNVQFLNDDQMADLVALQDEPWTYQPFAYLKEKGWQGIEPGPGLFYVGPLARFNAGHPATTPRAEEERQHVIQCLGQPPVYTMPTAFAAMAVEIVQAVETLQQLCSPQKLAGPSLRTIPTQKGDQTWTVLETPQGFTWHQYRVDQDGCVQEVCVIDQRAANNALKCLLAKQVIGSALDRNCDPAEIKEQAALALLPF